MRYISASEKGTILNDIECARYGRNNPTQWIYPVGVEMVIDTAAEDHMILAALGLNQTIDLKEWRSYLLW